MPRKKIENITGRILSPTFFLGALPGELADLSKRGAQARRELEAAIRKGLDSGAHWPGDELGRAAFVLFLLNNADLASAEMRHMRDTKAPAPSRITMDWRKK